MKNRAWCNADFTPQRPKTGRVAKTPGARVNPARVNSRPVMVPTGAVAHEPVSIGIADLSVIGVTGASTLVAGIVGGAVLSALSIGISINAGVAQ
jgi:hypothetical protein